MSSIKKKIVFLGGSSVGKSSILLRFTNNQFQEGQEPNVGASFLTKELSIENLKYKLQIWDTAGQERYSSMAPMYYRSASGAIIVYDITDSESFITAKKWVKELQQMGPIDVKMAIVGNKVDLSNDRQVSIEEVKEYAESSGALFFETSAKTGKNVYELFRQLLTHLPKTNSKKNLDEKEGNIKFVESEDKPNDTCC
ncbi:ras-related protein rab-5c [Anaeramoeba flamelloides]|uniref:Ras-related protein rab-5c n=1 Tax=Anaeramoeba flamelloides TaxID=1746091 RepID=A0AAV7YYN8_9EUKA|nr:ras-related protein rab-5c [Anaeramoeba flamelloides]